MFLRELQIKNYMIHQDTTVLLQPLTVFVGPNGGGKSALFDALLNFSMVSRGNLRQAFGPYPFSFRSSIYRGAKSKVSKIGYRVVMARHREDPDSIEYEIDYAQTGQNEDVPQFTISRERIIAKPGNAVTFDRADPDAHPIAKNLQLENDRSLFAAVRYEEAAGGNVPMDRLLEYCTQQISRFNKFRLDPGVLGQPSRLPDPSASVAPRLGYHGEDLAATLYHLNETRDPVLQTIVEKVKLLIHISVTSTSTPLVQSGLPFLQCIQILGRQWQRHACLPVPSSLSG
jgi:predicted ATPase